MNEQQRAVVQHMVEALEQATPHLPVHTDWHFEAIEAGKALLEQPVQEPCGWQFYQDGKWHNGMDTNDHRANTEAAGFPVRDVYPEPQPEPVQEPVAADLLEALTGMVDEFEGCYADADPTLIKARAAIAKATGGA
jgi:hypothetical protein